LRRRSGRRAEMESSGHFGFTAAVSYLVVWLAKHLGLSVGWWDGAILILGSSFLASIPDIDIRLRRVGVRHRGFTHTVWFALILAAVAYAVLEYLAREGYSPPVSPLVGALTVSMAVITHIAADALNYRRVRPLSPLTDAGVALRLFRSSNALANAGYFLTGVVAVTAYFYGVIGADKAVELVVLGLVVVTSLAVLADKLGGRGRR